jgi:hypothetical protein
MVPLASDLLNLRYANASQVPRKLAATEELQPRNLLLVHSASGQPARVCQLVSQSGTPLSALHSSSVPKYHTLN